MSNPDMLAPEFIPGDKAIWTKNASALKAAVDAGWRWPRFVGQKSGCRTHDVALLFFVIEQDWLEGWKILAEGSSTTEECQSEEALRPVVQGCRSSILKDVIERGWLPSDWSDEFGRSWVHLLFYPLDRSEGHPLSQVSLIEVADCLQKCGVDLSTPYPGHFEPKDMQRSGHTLWSFAIRQQQWHLARAICPAGFISAGPRVVEILNSLIETTQGEMSWFALSSPTREHQEHARKLLMQWWKSSSVLEEMKKLDPAFRQEISWIWTYPWAWSLLLDLPAPARHLIMESWSIPNEKDQTGWHRLALSVDDDRFGLILEEAYESGIDLVHALQIKDAWETRAIDAATLGMGYELPENDGPWEADRRLLNLPAWPPRAAS